MCIYVYVYVYIYIYMYMCIYNRDVPIRLRDRKSGPITWFQTRSESDVTSRSGLGYICIYILIIF